MSLRSLVLIVAFVFACCLAGPRSASAGPRDGAVQPAPPGPIDLVRILFGDFSGLCPRDYEYCHGGRHSVCCPFSRGCCAAADGSPMCCVAAPGEYRDDYAQGPGGYVPPPPPGAPPPPPPGDDYDQPADDSCPSTDLSCTQGGRRVCCSRDDGCCVDSHGPYCCRR